MAVKRPWPDAVLRATTSLTRKSDIGIIIPMRELNEAEAQEDPGGRRWRGLAVAGLLLILITAALCLLAPAAPSLTHALPYVLPMVYLMRRGHSWGVVTVGVTGALLLNVIVFAPRFALSTDAESLFVTVVLAALAGAMGLLSSAA